MTSLSEWKRRIALYNYNAAVDLAMHSHIPYVRELMQKRAKELAEEFGLKELQDV